MKKISIAFLVLAIVVLLVTSINAESFSSAKKGNDIVENLENGLVSENSGLRVSSALVLGQLIDTKYIQRDNADKTLVSLMKMLDNGKSDEEKIAAALALFKVGNAMGIYKLKGSSKFDHSKRVKDICYKLYQQFHIQNGTEYLLENY